MLYENVAAALPLGATALSSQAFSQEARQVEFGLRAHVEHNSNVARTNETRAALRGLTLDDTLFTPQAPVGRQAVFLRRTAGYSFYNKNDKLNRQSFETGIEKTIAWYLANEAWWAPILARSDAGQRLGLKTVSA